MLIHITGASGSGTTTLGVALAQRLGAAHMDTDDYFWLPSEPRYTTRRDGSERRFLLLADLDAAQHAVVSGSLMGWGAELEDAFALIVFLYVPTAARIERLQRRETARYGSANPEFLAWAAEYDNGPKEGRSLAKQQAWLHARHCPVLALEGDLAIAACVDAIASHATLAPDAMASRIG